MQSAVRAWTIIGGAVLFCGYAENVALPQQPDIPLRDELLAMARRDQELRTELVRTARDEQVSLSDPIALEKVLGTLIARIKKVDEMNREKLKSIVAEHGWPVIDMVGRQASHAAWLIVQHSNGDRAFQKQCLDLMKSAPQGQVEPSDVAYLTDRVLRGEGKPQLYGTQVHNVNGQWVPEETSDPDRLNQRRKAMGLDPIEDYLKQVRNLYSHRQHGERTEGDGR